MRNELKNEQFSVQNNFEKLLIKIEKIEINDDDREEVTVSFWKASEMSSQGFSGFFKMKNIC